MQILDGMDDRIFNVPMRSSLVKSLNLANVATTVAYPSHAYSARRLKGVTLPRPQRAKRSDYGAFRGKP